MSAKYIFRYFSGIFLRIFPPGGRVRDAYRRGAGPLGCCRNPGRKNRPATRWLPPGIGCARPAAGTITYPHSLAHCGLFLRRTPPHPGGDPVQPAAGSQPATFLRHWVFPPLPIERLGKNAIFCIGGGRKGEIEGQENLM